MAGNHNQYILFDTVFEITHNHLSDWAGYKSTQNPKREEDTKMPKMINISVTTKPRESSADLSLPKTHENEVSEQEFVQKAWEYLLRESVEEQRPHYSFYEDDGMFENGPKEFRPDFLSSLLPGNPLMDAGRVIVDQSVHIYGVVEPNRKWAVLRISQEQEAGKQTTKWYFAKIITEDGAEQAREVWLSDLWATENGDIEGEDVWYRAFVEVWPLPMFEPKKYHPLGRLNYELSSWPTNPLTILHSSPQPYKGLGQQVVAQMAAVRCDILYSYGFREASNFQFRRFKEKRGG